MAKSAQRLVVVDSNLAFPANWFGRVMVGCSPRQSNSDTVKTIRPVTKKKKTKQFELSLESLNEAAECLRILAHPHRLMMIQLLLSGEKLTVGELAEKCEISQPQTSDHLRLMQRCGFLTSNRDGRSVIYVVTEPHLQNFMSCIEARFGTEVS